jgi:hypothetical protein
MLGKAAAGMTPQAINKLETRTVALESISKLGELLYHVKTTNGH